MRSWSTFKFLRGWSSKQYCKYLSDGFHLAVNQCIHVIAMFLCECDDTTHLQTLTKLPYIRTCVYYRNASSCVIVILGLHHITIFKTQYRDQTILDANMISPRTSQVRA